MVITSSPGRGRFGRLRGPVLLLLFLLLLPGAVEIEAGAVAEEAEAVRGGAAAGPAGENYYCLECDVGNVFTRTSQNLKHRTIVHRVNRVLVFKVRWGWGKVMINLV